MIQILTEGVVADREDGSSQPPPPQSRLSDHVVGTRELSKMQKPAWAEWHAAEYSCGRRWCNHTGDMPTYFRGKYRDNIGENEKLVMLYYLMQYEVNIRQIFSMWATILYFHFLGQ